MSGGLFNRWFWSRCVAGLEGGGEEKNVQEQPDFKSFKFQVYNIETVCLGDDGYLSFGNISFLIDIYR